MLNWILKGVTLGLVVSVGVSGVSACTAVYVGKDLTVDGTTLFGRTEDLEMSHNKTFVVFDAKTNEPGATLVDESTGFTFDLPEKSFKYTALPDTTPEYGLYHEAGFNEFGVMVDATVSTAASDAIYEVDPLVEDGLTESILPSVVLPHVKTAREGVELVAHIVDEKGAGEGNSFIIADQKETWYMEILSGHQYAAIELADDKFVVFPNSFFMETIDLDNPNTDTLITSKDLKSVAEKAGTYVEEDGMMHVTKSYAAPISDGVVSRYWAGVNLLNPDENFPLDSTDFPFYHDTDKEISVQDIMALQRNRFEETDYIPGDALALATGGDVEEVEKPDNALYPIGNKNTMEAHIFQVYEDFPTEVPGVMWLSIGNPLVSPYLPFYGNITDTADPYQVTTNEPDEASYYWHTDAMLTHLLTHEDDTKDAYRQAVQDQEAKYMALQEEWQEQLLTLYGQDPQEAADYITDKTITMANDTFEWLTALREKMVTD